MEYQPLDPLTEAMKEKEREILGKVKKLFDENGVEFCLAFGSVLGAVRHQGMIPWDDDIDIYIRGEDYPRVREIFRTHDTGDLALHDHTLVKGYPYTFPKIVDTSTKATEIRIESCGYEGHIYLDVFPLYGVSNSAFVRFFQKKARLRDYRTVFYYFVERDTFIKKLAAKIVRVVFSKKQIAKIQDWIYRRFLSGMGNNDFVVDGFAYGKRLFPREYFFPPVELPFDGMTMPVPKDYDRYLTQIYGDYMTPPPIEKRVSLHGLSHVEIDGKQYD